MSSRNRAVMVRLSDEEIQELDNACNGRPRGETVRVALLSWLSRQESAKSRDQTPTQAIQTTVEMPVNPYLRGTTKPGGKMPNVQVAPPEVALAHIAEARNALATASEAAEQSSDAPNMTEESAASQPPE